MDPRAALAAVLSTAREVDPDPVPRNILYIAVGCDLALTDAVTAALTGAGLMTQEHQALTLTDAGREAARKVDEALNSAAMAV